MSDPLASLTAAIAARASLVTDAHDSAFRLCNGFNEGLPTLALDIYGTTLVVHDYGDEALAETAATFVCEQLPWLTAVLCKTRKSADDAARNGRLLRGDEKTLARKVREHGVWYALALGINRDASLYLDTRDLRRWAKDHLAGKRVLNAFAYTGSLGVAARAAPASSVLQTDRDRAFLFVAKDSYAMNGFPVNKADFRVGDFFTVVAQLKRESALFDCVFLDPPFFSASESGRVDVEHDMEALINKVRPIVGDGGCLVAVNNGLFVPGAEYHAMLERICAQGYATIEALVPVPDDCVGGGGGWPADPAPFNHPTKIAVLRLRRKDGRKA
jgi:23S rRNA (cytosine1962-C5)-methyltransferase